MMKPNNTLTISYLSKHPDNAARVLESLPHLITANFLENLSPEEYFSTFENLMPLYGAKLLETLSEDVKNKLISVLSIDKLSILLRFLNEADVNNILAMLSAERRKKIISRMKYPSNTVGSIMKPPLNTMSQDISVAEALKMIRTSRLSQFSEVFVLDNDLHYIGMISLEKLIQAQPHKKLNSITSHKVVALISRKSLKNLSENPAWTSNRVLPVIDGRGLLIGVLDYATLLKYKTMEIPQDNFQQINQASALELFFQTLTVPIEALVVKMFPHNKTISKRNR